MTAYFDNTEAEADPLALTQAELREIYREIEEQPNWRATADKEMDYADGNQLDSELLNRQRELGIPPAIEDITGPTLLAVQGYERKTRQDWRVSPNGQAGGQDVADALNFKLNEAERLSRADDACSDAFRPQIAVGLGWVEVSRDSDPFQYPYRCKAIHRNEIRWSMTGTTEADLSDCPWLHRERWMRPERLALTFPQHKELIEQCGKHGGGWYVESAVQNDGGNSTGLSNAWGVAAAQTIREQHWYNATSKELALAEIWYRRWVSVPVLRTPDGRVVEFDEANPAHSYAAATGMSKVTMATCSRVRRSYWLGPHLLDDGPSPYPHDSFPYVPFWGFREDGSGLPYGYVRSMIFQQDSLNSGISKVRWGMSSVRVRYTDGVTDLSDAQIRRSVARVDSVIKLNPGAVAAGGYFEVERDFQLNAQQMEMLQMARNAIEKIGPASNSFQGRTGNATSGRQEEAQIEQANQSLGHMMGMFARGRTQVGELLMSLIVEDFGDEEQAVVIAGDAVTEDRTVVINKPEQDPAGYTYLSNDLQRTRLMVSLEDVPSNSGYRAQQLSVLGESIKSLPPEYQAAAMPFLTALMDIPFKEKLIEAFRGVGQQATPEQIEQQTQQAVQQALKDSGNAIKERELDLKYGPEKMRAEIAKIVSETVKNGVESAFSAMQAGQVIAQMPQVAPVADVVMQSAGYRRPTPAGDDPDYPQPQIALPPDGPPEMPGVQQNTSPQLPPVPQDPASAMQGIETQSVADNLQGQPA